MSLRSLAGSLGISPAYLSDIENSKRNPPELYMLESISEVLGLAVHEKHSMMDYAGIERGQVAPDLRQYLMAQPEARRAIRLADEGMLGREFWRDIVQQIESKCRC